jgi:hypothetical protein
LTSSITLGGVAAVGHAHRDLDAAPEVGECPVDDLVRDQLGVGQDHLRALRRAQRAGADADGAHFAHQLAQLYGIADADGTLEDQHQTRHEVVDDVLQTEADADAERAREQRDLTHVHAGSTHRHQEPEGQHEIAAQPADGRRDTARQVQLGQHILVEQKAHQPRRLHRQIHGQREAHQIAERDAPAAYLRARAEHKAQQRERRIHQPERIQGGRCPQHDAPPSAPRSARGRGSTRRDGASSPGRGSAPSRMPRL